MKWIALIIFLLIGISEEGFAQGDATRERVITKSNFRYQDFDDLVDFSDAEFKYEANFRSAKFKSGITFNHSSFQSNSIFNHSRFFERSIFFSVKFTSEVSFVYSKFHTEVYFNSATFHALTNFRFVTFDSVANFSSAKFDGLVIYNRSNFHASADFSEAEFNNKSSFKNVVFDGPVNFAGAQFNSEVDFTSVDFRSSTDFFSSVLPPLLILNKSKSRYEIDLTSTKLDSAKRQKCLIDLIDAPIQKIKMTYDNFRVLKPDTILSQLHFQKLNSVYEQLLKNFKSRGYLSSYETLDKEYQEFKNIQNPNHTGITKVYKVAINFITKIWNDYGYQKERIWLFAVGLLLLFTCINHLLLKKLIKSVYTIEPIHQAATDKVLKSLWSMNRFGLAIYYTSLIFFGLKMSIEGLNFNHKTGVFYIFIQYILGLICLAYLANFIISSQLIGG